ncbi:MAG TPA: C-GCAxxG-C-C family (seleno)protein, partial [Bacillota bacterium]|nr:C-GCAxxG-C-C family (seleno)protein [Bacillota bacterium]
MGRELFLANYNCAQSTLAGVLSEFNRAYEQRIRLAGAFGAGIAQQGLMCGAVTGALMAFGVMVPMGSDIGRWKQEQTPLRICRGAY